jgi:acyl-CoA reductase-like NAD-dependent aldehyde dehydrogenase
MSLSTPHRDSAGFRAEALRIGGERVRRERTLDVFNPYTNERVGTVPLASVDDVREAFRIGHAYRSTLSRYERASILQRACALLRARADEAAASSPWSRACAGKTRCTKSAASPTC